MQFIDLDPTVRVNLRKAAAQAAILDALENPHHSFDYNKQVLLADATRVQDLRFLKLICPDGHFDYEKTEHFHTLCADIALTHKLIAQRRRANANFTARAKEKVAA